MASDGNDLRAEEAIRIRQATISDAHAIAEIVIRGWQAAYRAILPDDFLAGLSVGAREVAWRMRLESSADGGDPIWVAEVAGVTIGFVSGGPPRDNESPSRAAEIYAKQLPRIDGFSQFTIDESRLRHILKMRPVTPAFRKIAFHRRLKPRPRHRRPNKSTPLKSNQRKRKIFQRSAGKILSRNQDQWS